MIDLSAEEMVDWANANMERVEELENTVERLTAERDQARNARDIYASEIERLQARVEDAEFIIRGLLYGPYTHKAEMRGYKFLAVTEQEGEGAVRVGPNSTGITDDMIID